MITRHMYTSALLSLALFAATADAALAADVIDEESCTADVEFAGYNTTLSEQTVFANTYVSAGAGSAGGETIYGNILANTYVTMGAGSTVTGNIQTGTILTTGDSATVEGSTLAAGASTLGASSKVYTDLQSGTAVTLGASSQVLGDLEYGTVVTYGASATSGTDANNTTVPVIIDEHQGVLDAQFVLDSLTGGTNILPGNIATDTTFPSGVYYVNGLLTVTAGVTLTLDAQNQDAPFIFNISNYLTFGAGVNVEVINGTPNTRVIWNATGSYVSVGANANIVGTILARDYVSTGADSSVTGVGDCGGGAVYSGASYVSIGAGAVIGGQ
jgi:cytoskeletal protein CcmA (bactofilin family)